MTPKPTYAPTTRAGNFKKSMLLTGEDGHVLVVDLNTDNYVMGIEKISGNLTFEDLFTIIQNIQIKFNA